MLGPAAAAAGERSRAAALLALLPLRRLLLERTLLPLCSDAAATAMGALLFPTLIFLSPRGTSDVLDTSSSLHPVLRGLAGGDRTRPDRWAVCDPLPTGLMLLPAAAAGDVCLATRLLLLLLLLLPNAA